MLRAGGDNETTPEAGQTPPQRYVIMSGYHDYRSKRKANLHFIADELAKRGAVFFFSLRYSFLTRYKESRQRRSLVS